MTPPKRRSGAGYPAKKAPVATPRPAAASRSVGPTARTAHEQQHRRPVKRVRPGWHAVVGAILLLAGVVVIALNDAIRLGGVPDGILPGGHNEGYLVLGVALAAYSTWWFGWFDRAR